MGRVLKAANWGVDRILDGTGFLGIAIMISLSLFVAVVMMSRHVLALNIPGFFDAAMYVLIVFPLTTAAFTLRAEKHIIIDFFVSRLSEKAQAAIRIIAYLTVLVFSLRPGLAGNRLVASSLLHRNPYVWRMADSPVDSGRINHYRRSAPYPPDLQNHG